MKPRIVIAGGSGFIGRHLSAQLIGAGYDVTVLSRSLKAPPGAKSAPWDGKNPGLWASELDGAFAVVNLAGRNINCRPTARNLREIRDSRVLSVHALAGALSQVQNPPSTFVQASAVGFYGDAGDQICTESAPPGTDEIADLCQQWENAFALVAPPVRKVTLRLGVVLGRDGGFFPIARRLTRFFLGGQAGSGNQFISWIHITDLLHMILSAIEHAEVSGIYNATAPEPVTNKDFMHTLRCALKRPWSPPAPAAAVKLGAWLMGGDGRLALISQRAIPEHFLHQDFPFRFGELTSALQDLTANGKEDIPQPNENARAP